MAASARPTPVLPLVHSMTVPPGASAPLSSASRSICSPMRSFMEPPGFMYSTLARSWAFTPHCSGRRFRRTRGVLPMASQMFAATFMSPPRVPLARGNAP
jgi:hypothetical protein